MLEVNLKSSDKLYLMNFWSDIFTVLVYILIYIYSHPLVGVFKSVLLFLLCGFIICYLFGRVYIVTGQYRQNKNVVQQMASQEAKRDIISMYVFLSGGFKYFEFSPLFGEMIQFDVHIFQLGWHRQLVFLDFVWALGNCKEWPASLPFGVFSLNMCKVTMMTPSICGSTNPTYPPSEIRSYEGKPMVSMPLIRSYFWWGGRFGGRLVDQSWFTKLIQIIPEVKDNSVEMFDQRRDPLQDIGIPIVTVKM